MILMQTQSARIEAWRTGMKINGLNDFWSSVLFLSEYAPFEKKILKKIESSKPMLEEFCPNWTVRRPSPI